MLGNQHDTQPNILKYNFSDVVRVVDTLGRSSMLDHLSQLC